MATLLIDFETYSELNLKKAGAVKYAQHPSTRIICMSWGIDGAPPQVWAPDINGPPPAELVDAVRSGCLVEAHNVAFEWAVWTFLAEPHLGFPRVEDWQWRDSMAACGYRALPLPLEKAGPAVGLENVKDKAGGALIGFLCSPDTKGRRTYDRPDAFERRMRLHDYCAQDYRTEYELSSVARQLPADELAVWQLDQKINRRGIKVDVELCEAAVSLARAQAKRMNAELRELTGGAVGAASEVAKLREWLAGEGLDLPNMTADTVAEELRVAEKPHVRRALEIRQALARSSAKKYQAALNCVCEDGRAYYQTQYHAASTGRWGGRLIQPQNFRRPLLGVPMEDLADAITTRDPELVEAIYGDVNEVLADAVRGIFVAGEGRRYVCGDLSAIEAVILACVAGERWKIELFERGEKPYLAAASKVFKRPITSKEEFPMEYAVGKVCELAFGYGGGVGAWRNFDSSDDWTDEQIDGHKMAWRGEHPRTTELWRSLEDCAVLAVLNPDKRYGYHGVEFSMRGAWLTCLLPSGRRLWYRDPEIRRRLMPWVDRNDEPVYKNQLRYMSYKEGQWKPVWTYGGKLTENVVQAVARDCLVYGMFEVEAAGLPIVLTVHDEALAEPEEGRGATVEEMEELMSRRAPWAESWPIRAEAWTGHRYRK